MSRTYRRKTLSKELAWELTSHLNYEHHDSYGWRWGYPDIPPDRTYPYTDLTEKEIVKDKAIFYSDAGRCFTTVQMKKHIRQIVRSKHRSRKPNELRKLLIDPDYEPNFMLEKEKDVWLYN